MPIDKLLKWIDYTSIYMKAVRMSSDPRTGAFRISGETSLSSDVDVLVVGAGAAGLSAAYHARLAGLRFEILEAKDRIGGRAFTESASLGVPMDHGAHYLHAASRNPLRDFADARGISYRKSGYRTKIFDGAWLSDSEQEAFYQYAKARLEAVGLGADSCDAMSTADVLANGRDHLQIDRLTDLFNGYYIEFLGASPSEVAAAEHKRYVDTYEDWPVENGFGDLICQFGASIPVVLGCSVNEIDHSGRNIVVHTSKGSIAARYVIITVSTGVLASENIRFTPSLAVEKLRSIDALPMGYAGKIAFRLHGTCLGDIETHHGLINRPDGFFSNLHVRPFEKPMVVLIVGGPRWEMIERSGANSMIEMGRQIVRDLYGSNALKDLGRAICTNWVSDGLVRGGHSYMRPGNGRARAALAEPVNDRLFFCGEATSEESWATVHGAYESGRRAISAIASAPG